MSYYFTIISPTDRPLFEHQFGSSKQGNDGIARFSATTHPHHLLQLIAHSSLDLVEEYQWLTGASYLKTVDQSHGLNVSAFVTGTNVRFLLLCDPAGVKSGGSSMSGSQQEEAVRQFFGEVWECWLKAAMNPFLRGEDGIASQVFRGRIAAAGKKYL